MSWLFIYVFAVLTCTLRPIRHDLKSLWYPNKELKATYGGPTSINEGPESTKEEMESTKEVPESASERPEFLT